MKRKARKPPTRASRNERAKRMIRKTQRLGEVLRHKQPRRREEVVNLLGRFGRYLQQRREERGMSIREFAELVGIPHSNIFQFEQLRKNPRLTELGQIARALGESLEDFVAPLQPDPPLPPTPEMPLSIEI